MSAISWNDAASEDEVKYAAWSVAAILSAICGAASFLTFINVWWSFFAVAAVLLACVSLASIARADGTLIGRRAALAGIALAIISSVAVSTFWVGYTALLRRDADQFARLWFNTVQDDNIPQIAAMTLPYWSRAEVGDHEEWWNRLTEKSETSTHRAVHNIVDNKLIRTLIALRGKSTISLYRAEPVAFSPEKNIVPLIYAVTFRDENDQPKTFLVRIVPTQTTSTVSAKKVSGWSLTPMPSTVYVEGQPAS
ncbi:MAG: hypothetical protein ACRC46_06215 [Thermoguttaceae bacterium]